MEKRCDLTLGTIVHVPSDWLIIIFIVQHFRLMDILDMILQYCHKQRMSESTHCTRVGACI